MRYKGLWNTCAFLIEIISALFVSGAGGYTVYKMATDLFRLSAIGTLFAFLMIIALMFFIEFMFRLFMFIWDSMK